MIQHSRLNLPNAYSTWCKMNYNWFAILWNHILKILIPEYCGNNKLINLDPLS